MRRHHVIEDLSINSLAQLPQAHTYADDQEAVEDP